VRSGRDKKMFMVDQPLIRRLQCNFCYACHLDHIYNQTLASNSLSMKMVQVYFEKSSPVRQGHLWLTKLKFVENKLLINISTMKVIFSYCPMLEGHLKCFISYSLTSYDTFFFIS
jgi:hypothetical protein